MRPSFPGKIPSAIKKATDPQQTILQRYYYRYDPAGNRLSEQIDDAVTSWTYDSLNRLVTQTPGGWLKVRGQLNETGTVSVNGAPALVSAANLFEGLAQVNAGTTVFTITAADLTGNTATARYEVDTAGAAKVFTFDANGNLTSDGTRTFEWDARNQLVAVTVGTHRSEFTYEGLQRRVRQIEKEDGVTQSDTRVLWCETAICEERAADGVTVRRAFGLGEQVNGTARYFTVDHLGSVREVTDTVGTVLARYAFDSWGRRTVTAGTDVTSVGFTGHRTHTSSGLALALLRGYDAEGGSGRWISEDPIGLLGGMNRYGYAENNPLRFMDPGGAASLSVTGPGYHVVSDWDALTAGCRGRGGFRALGCTTASVKIDCDCSYDGCYWRPRVSIAAKIDVYIIDNPRARASAETIRHEENKHVRAITAILEQLKKRGDALEGQKYRYRTTCQAACLAFRGRGYMELMMSGPLVHMTDPHPY